MLSSHSASSAVASCLRRVWSTQNLFVSSSFIQPVVAKRSFTVVRHSLSQCRHSTVSVTPSQTTVSSSFQLASNFSTSTASTSTPSSASLHVSTRANWLQSPVGLPSLHYSPVEHTSKTSDRSSYLTLLQHGNIILMGPPGSGKSSIGRTLAASLNMPHLDVDDDWLEVQWKDTVANKLKEFGEDKFLEEEGKLLSVLARSFALPGLSSASSSASASSSSSSSTSSSLLTRPHVISLTGSNPLIPSALSELSKTGLLYYLDVQPTEILARMERMKVNRIVGQNSGKSLASILAWRRQIYENSYDVRVLIQDNETIASIARKIQQHRDLPQTFISTRGVGLQSQASTTSHDKSFLDVVRQGLSACGGLFLSRSCLPFTLSQVARLTDLPYQELVLRIIERFPLGNLHPQQLKSFIYQAYDAFYHPDILPLTTLKQKNSKQTRTTSSSFSEYDNMYLLETFHGPTASFKDLSLQLLPHLLNAAMEEAHVKNTAVSSTAAAARERVGLLVATSGDTGTAALDGFAKFPQVPVCVLYPADGVSIVQKTQMESVNKLHSNVACIAVEKDFDFCQTLVKDIFNNASLLQEFKAISHNLHFSSANSMNFGRFVPQVAFTFGAYAQLLRSQRIQLGEDIDVVVPTGNFGNILGAIYAKMMGLPLRKIVCASNDNNILYDFLTTGVYDIRARPFFTTNSPSIDILISSNLERFLYILTCDINSQTKAIDFTTGDYSLISTLFQQLKTEGHFTLPPALFQKLSTLNLQASWCDETLCRAEIKQVYEQTGQIVDPHTAVAVHVARQTLARAAQTSQASSTPIVICATAHYGKFPDTLCQTFQRTYSPQDLQSLTAMYKHVESIFEDKQQYQQTMHRKLEELKTHQITQRIRVQPEASKVIEIIKSFLTDFEKYVVKKK